MEPADIEKQKRYKSMQINNALGIFILFFGIVVIIAVPFSDNYYDKMTNLIAGVILSLIGGGTIWYAQRVMKSLGGRKGMRPDNKNDQT